MAYFAKLDGDNKVISVHSLSNDLMTYDQIEVEQIGIDFLANLHGHLNWKQTSYNKSFRKNYAAIGDYYDPEKDAFIQPKPHKSWTLNENTCQWEPPIPFPIEDPENIIPFFWDDNSESWVDSRTVTPKDTGDTNVY